VSMYVLTKVGQVGIGRIPDEDDAV
jgi:hypothetical protein